MALAAAPTGSAASYRIVSAGCRGRRRNVSIVAAR